MAITSSKFTGSQGGFTRQGGQSLVLTYDAYSDDPADSEVTVRTYFETSGVLPYLGRQHPDESLFYCDQMRVVRQDRTNPVQGVFRCSFTYTPLYESWRGEEEDGTYTEDPLAARREILFDWGERTVDATSAVFEGCQKFNRASGNPVAWTDLTEFGNFPWDGAAAGAFPKTKQNPAAADIFGPIENSKGDAYDVPLDQRKVDMVLRIRKYVAAIDAGWKDLFDTVNDKDLQITQALYGIDELFKPFSLKFHDYNARPRYLNTIRCHEIEFEFWYRKETWGEDIFDEGLNASGRAGAPDGKGGPVLSALDAGAAPSRKIADRVDQPVVALTPLDGSSQPNQDDAHWYFNRYRVERKDALEVLPVSFLTP